MPNVSREVFLADRRPNNWEVVITGSNVAATNFVTGTVFTGTVTQFNAYLAVQPDAAPAPITDTATYDLTTGDLVSSSVVSAGPAFFAYPTVGQTINGWQKVTLNAVRFDTAGLFNTAQSRFVANQAGIYQFSGCLSDNHTGQRALLIYRNGVASFGGNNIPANGLGVVISGLIKLAVGDYVEFFAYSTNTQAVAGADESGNAGTFFCGHLVMVYP